MGLLRLRSPCSRSLLIGFVVIYALIQLVVAQDEDSSYENLPPSGRFPKWNPIVEQDVVSKENFDSDWTPMGDEDAQQPMSLCELVYHQIDVKEADDKQVRWIEVNSIEPSFTVITAIADRRIVESTTGKLGVNPDTAVLAKADIIFSNGAQLRDQAVVGSSSFTYSDIPEAMIGCLVIPPMHGPIEFIRLETHLSSNNPSESFKPEISICSYKPGTPPRSPLSGANMFPEKSVASATPNGVVNVMASSSACHCTVEAQPMIERGECRIADIPTLASANFATTPFFLSSTFFSPPSYYNAREVTITTVLTVDQLPRLKLMSEFWGGPISATVFISSRNAEAEIKLLVQTWLSSTYLWSFVDIHVAFAPYQSEQSSTGASAENASASKKFPINFLRNVAIQNARTALVLSLDVDFITSALLHPSLRSLRDVLIGSEKTVFLVPAFQATASFNITNAPKLKRDAKSQVLDANPTMVPFNNPLIDYDRWFEDDTFRELSIPADSKFVSFYITLKTAPLYDESFDGCKSDRTEHLEELRVAGYRARLLPVGFVVHNAEPNPSSCGGYHEEKNQLLRWGEFKKRLAKKYNPDGVQVSQGKNWWMRPLFSYVPVDQLPLTTILAPTATKLSVEQTTSLLLLNQPSEDVLKAKVVQTNDAIRKAKQLEETVASLKLALEESHKKNNSLKGYLFLSIVVCASLLYALGGFCQHITFPRLVGVPLNHVD